MANDNNMNQVILGLLNHEDLTGYEIKKRIDGSLHYFWKGSFGSIYPTLASLEEQGMIVKVDDHSHSKRERIVYRITDVGRDDLVQWLEESKTSNSLKYEMLLKLFFCCQGIGRQLFGEAYKKALEEGYSFMQVKTVKMSVYKRIRARSM